MTPPRRPATWAAVRGRIRPGRRAPRPETAEGVVSFFYFCPNGYECHFERSEKSRCLYASRLSAESVTIDASREA